MAIDMTGAVLFRHSGFSDMVGPHHTRGRYEIFLVRPHDWALGALARPIIAGEGTKMI